MAHGTSPNDEKCRTWHRPNSVLWHNIVMLNRSCTHLLQQYTALWAKPLLMGELRYLPNILSIGRL